MPPCSSRQRARAFADVVVTLGDRAIEATDLSPGLIGSRTAQLRSSLLR
jgi:hypothetical protein